MGGSEAKTVDVVCSGAALADLSPFLLYPHQEEAIEGLRLKIAQGLRRLVLVIPTGGGKSYVAGEMSFLANSKGKRWLVISNRRIVHERLARLFQESDMTAGLVDADYKRGRPYWKSGHVAMLQTLASRHIVPRDGQAMPDFDGELPPANVVFIDEAHLNRGAWAVAIIWYYVQLGAVVIGLTATPVGCGAKLLPGGEPLYQGLVEAGSNSTLQECGLLVNGDVFAPDEPNLKGIRPVSAGEYAESALDRRFKGCRYVVWGRILENYEKINPTHRPAILFGPSVDGSRFLAEQFDERYGRGFARHIDAKTTEKERDDVLGSLADSDPLCRVLCNYGVAEVGLDCPALSHAIFVRTYGRPSTYIQCVGRVKRAHPGKERYTLQDHSGSVWRHGHPDTDWTWKIEYTDGMIRQLREREMAKHPERQEITCPECSYVRRGGDVCPFCLHRHKLSIRVVIETDGRLIKVRGPAFKPKKAKTPEKAWKSEVWAGIICNRSVMQAVERFRWNNPGMEPPANIPAGAQALRKLRHIYPEIARAVDRQAEKYRWSSKGGKYKAKAKGGRGAA